MVDNLNPTNQFHPYQPMKDVPIAEREPSGLQSIGKLRAYAQANPGKVLGGLAAVMIGLGLMRRR